MGQYASHNYNLLSCILRVLCETVHVVRFQSYKKLFSLTKRQFNTDLQLEGTPYLITIDPIKRMFSVIHFEIG